MNSKMLLLALALVAVLGLSSAATGPASPSAANASPNAAQTSTHAAGWDTVLRAASDGTVVDSTFDGTGDWVNGSGAAVGYNHPGIGLGEYRAVYEFDLGKTADIGRMYAYIDLRLTGSWGGPDEPRLILYAGRGDGAVTPEDFSPPSSDLVGERNIYDLGLTLDITSAVKRALPSRYVRVVVAPYPSPPDTGRVWLFGSRSLEALYGDGYRTAHLIISAKSPGERQIDDLVALVQSFALQHKVEAELTTSLFAAQRMLAASGKPSKTKACSDLDYFIQTVATEKGVGLMDWQAEWLTTQGGGGPAGATNIETTIGC